MNIRSILSGGAAIAFAALPAAALADLQVQAVGFHRVVAASHQGASCEVHPSDNGTLAICPDGARGTMTLYRARGEGAVCEIDFWGQWRAQISHQNGAYGTCTLHWNGPDSLQVTSSRQPGSAGR